jgi:hypothetical protein
MPAIGLTTGSVTVSTNASALGAAACTGVLVQAHPSNTALVLLGTASSQVLHLSAGGQVTLVCCNVSSLYASTSGGSGTLLWLATRQEP